MVVVQWISTLPGLVHRRAAAHKIVCSSAWSAIHPRITGGTSMMMARKRQAYKGNRATRHYSAASQMGVNTAPRKSALTVRCVRRATPCFRVACLDTASMSLAQMSACVVNRLDNHDGGRCRCTAGRRGVLTQANGPRSRAPGAPQPREPATWGPSVAHPVLRQAVAQHGMAWHGMAWHRPSKTALDASTTPETPRPALGRGDKNGTCASLSPDRPVISVRRSSAPFERPAMTSPGSTSSGRRPRISSARSVIATLWRAPCEAWMPSSIPPPFTSPMSERIHGNRSSTRM